MQTSHMTVSITMETVTKRHSTLCNHAKWWRWNYLYRKMCI